MRIIKEPDTDLTDLSSLAVAGLAGYLVAVDFILLLSAPGTMLW